MMRERLALRPVTADDLPLFFTHEQNREAQRMAGFVPPDPSDRGAFDAHWQRLLDDESIVKRTIELDGEVVGHIASWLEQGDREITYWIDPYHWGKGIATTAVALFVEELTDRPLFARAARDNLGSIRVLERNGFEIIGTDRGFANARGEEIDEVICRLSGP